MKRQLTSILLFSALLMGGASTFVSCTDHESDAAYEVTGTVADQVKKQATELENLVTKLDFLLKGGTPSEDLKNNLNQTIFGKDSNGNIITWDNAKLDVLKQALEAAKKEAEDAKKAANAYTDSKVNTLAQKIVDLDGAISSLTTIVNQNKEELNQLNTKVDNYAGELMQMLENYQASNTQMFNNLTNLYNDMDVRLQEDENRIANLEEAVRNNLATKEYVNEQIASLNTKIDGKVDASDFNAAIEAAKAAVLENKNAIAANKTEINKIKNELVNYATKQDLDDKAASLEAAFKAADKALEVKMQAQIADIQTSLTWLAELVKYVLCYILQSCCIRRCPSLSSLQVFLVEVDLDSIQVAVASTAYTILQYTVRLHYSSCEWSLFTLAVYNLQGATCEVNVRWVKSCVDDTCILARSLVNQNLVSLCYLLLT